MTPSGAITDIDIEQTLNNRIEGDIGFMRLTGDKAEAYRAGCKEGIGMTLAKLREIGTFRKIVINNTTFYIVAKA